MANVRTARSGLLGAVRLRRAAKCRSTRIWTLVTNTSPGDSGASVDLGPKFTRCVDRRELRRLEGEKVWLQTEVNPLLIGIPLAVRVKQANVRNLN